MAYIETFIPGQISISNHVPSAPAGDNYYAGQGAKIEVNQMNYNFDDGTPASANHAHMPNPYLPNSTNPNHVNSIFGELDRKMWLKFILLEVEWGRIETSLGVYNWAFIDFVFNTIRTLPKATGQDKKCMLLINFRNPGSLLGLEGLLPDYLLTQPGANSGHYKPIGAYPPPNYTTNPPQNVDPIVNAKKFDNLWCYEAVDPVHGGVLAPLGYNFNFHKFTAAAGTNTIKTRFYAFLQAIADHYGDDTVFGGLMTTEAAIGSPFASIVSGVTTTYESGNSRDQTYEGRRNILEEMRLIFAGHIILEDCNFDKPYAQSLTGAGATNGLVAMGIGFSPSNYHTGTGLSLQNINTVLKGKVPIAVQCQGHDQRTKTGNSANYYGWTPTPPGYGNPTAVIAGDGIPYNDPPTAQLLFDRFVYFGATHPVYQRNYATASPISGNTNLVNWPKWKIFMDASPYANDPLGGMNGIRPQFPW